MGVNEYFAGNNSDPMGLQSMNRWLNAPGLRGDVRF